MENKIYLITQYVYDSDLNVLGTEPVVAYSTEDAALDFMDTFSLGDEVVEVEFAWPLDQKFTEEAKVVYAGNSDAASQVLEDLFVGKRGKKPR